MGKNGELSIPRTNAMLKVWLLLLTVLSLFVEVLTTVSTSYSTPREVQFIHNIRNTFSQLSGQELLNYWHTDCHRRCRFQINTQVDIACLYDPYRINHRRRRSSDPTVNKTSEMSTDSNNMNITTTVLKDEARDSQLQNPGVSSFLSKTTAYSFLHQRPNSAKNPDVQLLRMKRQTVSIMEECCFSKACSWEEFGEYCQRHPRQQNQQQSVCSYS